MVFAHILGVLIEQFYHKTNMVMAMVSGFKWAKGEDIKLNFSNKFFGSLYIILVLIVSLYSIPYLRAAPVQLADMSCFGALRYFPTHFAVHRFVESRFKPCWSPQDTKPAHI